MPGIVVEVPAVCPLCAQQVGECYDVHMVLQHPETRPRPVVMADGKKKGRKKG